jgi:DNA-binding CsgD family transcriptional regulator
MSPLPARKKNAHSTADPAPGADVKGLLHCLIQRLVDVPPPTGAAANELAVMLDVQVDGVRCVFTKVPMQVVRPPFVLSPREREIARMVACGYPNKMIGGVLAISSWTVSTYLRRIFAKLNVNSRAAMVARLMEEGLLKN